jgi:hypothetical protein
VRCLILSCLCLLASAVPSAFAATAETPEGELQTTVLDTVVVSGRQPGPGLWKISKDDRVLWLLGTIAPTVSMRAEGAAFGGIFLIPSLLKARNNPEKEQLQDVLPAADYARWSVLKRKYLGRDRAIEKRRPIIAAAKLQEEALDEADLVFDNLAARVAKRTAKRLRLEITEPKVEILISDPKATIREFASTSLDDLECFRRTLDRLESDIETMKLRANAWALGDIELLQSLSYTDNFRACADALLETRIAEKQGFANLEQQLDAAWLAAAEAALARHPRSFALLPMSLMLREGGFLDQLRARGYTITPPATRPL